MEKKKKNELADLPTDAVMLHSGWFFMLVSHLVLLIYWINHPFEACSWQIQSAWYCHLNDVPLLEIFIISIVSVILWYQAERLRHVSHRMLIRGLILAYLFPGRVMFVWFIQNAPLLFAYPYLF